MIINRPVILLRIQLKGKKEKRKKGKGKERANVLKRNEDVRSVYAVFTHVYYR